MTFFWIKSFDHSDHNCLPPPVFSWKVVRFHGGCLHLILGHAGTTRSLESLVETKLSVQHWWWCPSKTLFGSSRDRLGPGTLCYSACTWTDGSSSNKYKEIIRTKNNCMYVQLVQIMDRKIQKDQKNPRATSEATSEKLEEKKHTPPSHAPKGL